MREASGEGIRLLMRKTDFKTLGELFWVIFKAGTFTFAGGLAMLPVIQPR